jgi:hypothetical protein
MALIVCSKCSKELSGNAIKCPHCGEYNRKGLLKYGFALLYVIVVTIVYYRWMAK